MNKILGGNMGRKKKYQICQDYGKQTMYRIYEEE